MMDDLFKNTEYAMTPSERRKVLGSGGKRGGKRKPTKKNGYAALPGTGPKGETCRSCDHSVKRGGSAGTFYKCRLMEKFWTGGAGTDILLRSPACRNWVQQTEKEKEG